MDDDSSSSSIVPPVPSKRFLADEPPLFYQVRPCDYCHRFVNTSKLSLCQHCFMKQEIRYITSFVGQIEVNCTQS